MGNLPRIVPAHKPEDRESAGVNPATCRHEFAPCKFAGYDYWCQICLIPGKPDDDFIEVDFRVIET